MRKRHQVVTKAVNGGYRIIGVDEFNGEMWLECDEMDRRRALRVAYERAGSTLKMRIFNTAGKMLAEVGAGVGPRAVAAKRLQAQA